MQMDLWVLAAATGAGYLAKYWKNVLRDKESSSRISSGSSFPENLESPSLIQQIGDTTLASNKSLQTEIAEKNFSEVGKGDHLDGIFTGTPRKDDPITADVACTKALDHEKHIEEYKECRDDFRLDADIPDVPEYNTWEMGASPDSRRSRKSLRTRCLQRLPSQYIKPRSSLDSCLMAQMHREQEDMKEYLLTPLSSPCTPALRPFLVTDGRRVICRASSDFRNEMCKAVHQKSDNEVVGIPHLPQIIKNGNSKMMLKKGETQMGKLSNGNNLIQSDTEDGSSSGQILFCFGISIGVMSTLIANKMEVEKLKDRLKQSENLVEDLQEELEMKDSLTVKELVNDDDSQDIHESSCSHEKINLISNSGVPIHYADEESVSLEKVETMSKIEAELEAELERLELSMKGSALQGSSSDAIELFQELDQDISAEVVHGELNADIFGGKSSSEPTPDQGSTPQPVKNGVSPRELSLRLHEVIQSRLQERIMELEAELVKSQKRVQHLELEKNTWRDVSQSESSSNLSSPVARPLVMNLSGDALDAYNEAYGELNKLSGSRSEDYWIHGDNQQDNQGMGDKLNGVQNSGNRSSPSDCDKEDNGDDDLLLIKQIVEKARQGSPAILKARKAMLCLNINTT